MSNNDNNNNNNNKNKSNNFDINSIDFTKISHHLFLHSKSAPVWDHESTPFCAEKIKTKRIFSEFSKSFAYFRNRSKIVVPNEFFDMLADFSVAFPKDSILGLLLFLISNNK